MGNRMFTNDPELDRLAIDLFVKFARVEYSLKAAGFHMGDGDAKPDWDALAAEISGKLESYPTLTDAVTYISKHPPKKQVIVKNVLSWDEQQTAPSNTQELLMYVRRVRNNLFHGGKFNGKWLNPERNKDLLSHTLCILVGCLEASPRLKRAFDDRT